MRLDVCRGKQSYMNEKYNIADIAKLILCNIPVKVNISIETWAISAL